LFCHVQRFLLMGDVFVTMRAYRKFFPNCAWRARYASRGIRTMREQKVPWSQVGCVMFSRLYTYGRSGSRDGRISVQNFSDSSGKP
jgi:hypothetical protein